MSLLNFWIERNRVLIGVDTIAFQLNANMPQGGEVDKLLVLPTKGAVIAVRGMAAVLPFLMLPIMGNTSADLDVLCTQMPAHFAWASAQVAGLVKANGQVMPDEGNEILLAGWSNSRKRMHAWFFRHQPGEPLTVDSDFGADGPEQQLCGWDDEIGEAPDVSTDAAMLQVMAAQVAHARRLFTGPPRVGGRFVLAELTRDGVSIRTHDALAGREGTTAQL